jgi:hypothetical protein
MKSCEKMFCQSHKSTNPCIHREKTLNVRLIDRFSKYGKLNDFVIDSDKLQWWLMVETINSVQLCNCIFLLQISLHLINGTENRSD